MPNHWTDRANWPLNLVIMFNVACARQFVRGKAPAQALSGGDAERFLQVRQVVAEPPLCGPHGCTKIKTAFNRKDLC